MLKPIVFVCEHGSAKSLIAREWFNRLSAARGLAVRAVSRGVRSDAAVPDPIVDRLRGDGFDVSSYEPRELARGDLAPGSRVVVIGAELPRWVSAAEVRLERWDGIPPASESYNASRDALRQRITALVDALAAEARAHGPSGGTYER